MKRYALNMRSFVLHDLSCRHAARARIEHPVGWEIFRVKEDAIAASREVNKTQKVHFCELCLDDEGNLKA